MLVLWSSSGTHIDVRLTATFLCWHHAALTVPTLGFRLLLHLYAGTMQLQQYPQRLETDCYILMLTLCNSNGIHIDFSLTATSLYWHHAGPMVPTDFSLIAHLSTPCPSAKNFPSLCDLFLSQMNFTTILMKSPQLCWEILDIIR